MPDLEIAPCRSQCQWQGTGARPGDEPVFRCSGCGSEWVSSEPWTPIDHTGEVPTAVQAERERVAAGRGPDRRGTG